jgi:DNA-binding NtrC family response regulator
MKTQARRIRILILENQKNWKKFVKSLLQNYEFEIKVICTPRGAWRVISKGKFDVLVVSDCVALQEDQVRDDVVLFVKKVRQAFPSLPVIANTSNCNYGDVLQSAGCFCQTFRSRLPKTISQLLKVG